MPNYAIIENGKVVNAVVSDKDYAASQNWVALPNGVGIDWDYDGEKFIDNRPATQTTITTEPTKEELLAQVQALMAQIQTLT